MYPNLNLYSVFNLITPLVSYQTTMQIKQQYHNFPTISLGWTGLFKCDPHPLPQVTNNHNCQSTTASTKPVPTVNQQQQQQQKHTNPLLCYKTCTQTGSLTHLNNPVHPKLMVGKLWYCCYYYHNWWNAFNQLYSFSFILNSSSFFLG